MFRFIRVTNQNIITLFEIEDQKKDNYSHYHLLMESLNSTGYDSMRVQSTLSHIYGAAVPVNNLITNVFTGIFWKYNKSQVCEDFVLFKRRGKIDLDDNKHIISLTNKDIKNIIYMCSKYNFQWEIKNEI